MRFQSSEGAPLRRWLCWLFMPDRCQPGTIFSLLVRTNDEAAMCGRGCATSTASCRITVLGLAHPRITENIQAAQRVIFFNLANGRRRNEKLVQGASTLLGPLGGLMLWVCGPGLFKFVPFVGLGADYQRQKRYCGRYCTNLELRVSR